MIDKGRCLALNGESRGGIKNDRYEDRDRRLSGCGPGRADGPGRAGHRPNAPAIVKAAGRSAEFAWEEFFQAEIANAHTRKNYLHAVRKFLAWVEGGVSSCPGSPPATSARTSKL